MANVDDDMGAEAIHPKNEEDDNNQNGDDEFDNINPEEYEMLDAKLDDLNTVLDLIEQKNDQIRAKFLKLLDSNKQIREEFQQEMQKNSNAVQNEQPPNENC